MDYAQYDAECEAAMVNQGLRALLDYFKDKVVPEFTQEQTGGFCMVLSCRHDGVVTVISGEGVDSYTLGVFTAANWDGHNGDEPLELTENLDRPALLTALNVGYKVEFEEKK